MGLEPGTPAWESGVPFPLPHEMRAGNFRLQTGDFEHLTQAMLSI